MKDIEKELTNYLFDRKLIISNDKIVDAIVDFINQATNDSTAKLEARIDFIESRFRHYHVNAQDGSDICKTCGIDLRDLIHCRG